MGRRLRFWVALCLVFGLWWWLLGVLEREADKAAELSANMILGQLRSALVIRGAEVMLDRSRSLPEQEGINPFDLIEHNWSVYAGSCTGDIPDPGQWCFRYTGGNDRGWLIFNPSQPITLKGRAAQPGDPLAWKVTAEFADRDGNGRREHTERLTGLKLAPVVLNRDTAATSNGPG